MQKPWYKSRGTSSNSSSSSSRLKEWNTCLAYVTFFLSSYLVDLMASVNNAWPLAMIEKPLSAEWLWTKSTIVSTLPWVKTICCQRGEHSFMSFNVQYRA
jgi:hypothetical protein